MRRVACRRARLAGSGPSYLAVGLGQKRGRGVERGESRVENWFREK